MVRPLFLLCHMKNVSKENKVTGGNLSLKTQFLKKKIISHIKSSNPCIFPMAVRGNTF